MEKHKVYVLIIESELESNNRIIGYLDLNPLVSGVEVAVNSEEAFLKFIDFSPDIVFFEYPIQGNLGKELIRFIRTKREETIIVFVSKTKKYATIAIRNEVFNYLLKPVNKKDIDLIIEKVHIIKQTNKKELINKIIEQNQEDTRIRLQTIKGYIILDPEEILYCKADGFCTEIFLTNNKNELSYLFLSKIEEILKQFNFMRVSRSYLINLKYIRKIYKSSNSIVLKAEGKEIEIKASKPHIKVLSKFDTD